MLIPLGGMIDGSFPSLGAVAGETTSLMGILVFGFLVVTTLGILLGGERRAS
jgi:hypothetical protein